MSLPTPVDHLLQAKWGSPGRVRVTRAVFTLLALALGVYQLYTAKYIIFDAFLQRVVHLMFVLLLVFLVFPAGKRSGGDGAARRPSARSWASLAFDGLLMALAATVSLYLVIDYDNIMWRIGLPNTTDIVMGTIAITIVLEATRRVVGRGMLLIVAAFLVYAYVGPYLPGILDHKGYSFERIVYHTYLFQEGIYGLPLGVAATFVFMFVLFGALLEKTGGGQFFIDLAYALTGRARGGPAKGAVVASGLMGSISGSAIANAVTTGAFTIPMMKRVGYKDYEAGGVEAAASTGGQLLPPVMGAGAFLMAELLGVPYAEIIRIAIIPAIMYFAIVFLFVDILARRHGIAPMRPEDVPKLGPTLVRGYHYLLPMVLLVALLFAYYTPMQAGLYAMGALLTVAMVRAHSRLGLRDVIDVFQIAARNTFTVSVACAAAGIIVGIVGLTGLGLKFSSAMLSFSGDHMWLALIMVGLASLVLGMGLPVTAAYIVLAVLAGPALVELGLPLLTAHMIVFWFSQDSNITPPVALAAFAASGVAGSNPMKTSIASWKFGKGLYIIPFLMAYSPLLLDGSLYDVSLAVVSGAAGMAAFAIVLEGFIVRPTTLVERGLLAVATVALITPAQSLDYVGMLLAAGVLLWHMRRGGAFTPPGQKGIPT